MLSCVSVRSNFDQQYTPLASQDSVSLMVPSSCTPTELTELAMRKWLTTHGPEEEARRGPYLLRVSHCLEFLGGDQPLIQYKVSGYALHALVSISG